MTTEKSTAVIQVWSQKKKKITVEGQEKTSEINKLEKGKRSATKKTNPTEAFKVCRVGRWPMKECW